jgi:hypothetical protein
MLRSNAVILGVAAYGLHDFSNDINASHTSGYWTSWLVYSYGWGLSKIPYLLQPPG